MKLWRLQYHLDDTPSGSCAEWFPNKRAALRRAAELKREYPFDDEGNPPDGTGFFFQNEDGSPDQVEIPTTRAALCAWLNTNAFAQ